MHRVQQQDLPFVGSSYQFVGADNGDTFEAGAGDVLVIKAGEVHSFKNIGEEPLVRLDIHLSPRFIQENI